MAKTASFDTLKKSAAAPAFTLPGIDGRMYGREDFRGKEGLFILFMCDHCPYVKARIGEVVALHRDFGDRLSFVGINPNDPAYPDEGMDNMRTFARERGMDFPYLLDESGAVARAYGATCTPDPFLFDKDLRLVFHGRLTDALEPEDEAREHTMRINMQKLLAGAPIEPWFDPSLGCSIKFKS